MLNIFKRKTARMRKDYKFACGIKAYQEELTGKQDFDLTHLLIDAELQDIDINKLSVRDLFSIFKDKQDLMTKLFAIILRTTALPGDKTFLDLKNSEMAVVLGDFFILNPWVKDALTGMLKQAATILKTTPLQNSKQNASSSVPAI